MHKLFSFAKPSPPEWAASLCGVTGAGLLLAGLVCFFAYNWADLGMWMKFGLPLLGLLVCAWVALLKGLSSGAGRVCSFACGVFVGIFWAVYGQVFQTGAFVYEFFFVWALCLLPLAVLAGNRWLWLLWAAVVNFYMAHYWTFGWFSAAEATRFFWSVFLFNVLCFFISEYVSFRLQRGDWLSLCFLVPALTVLFVRGVGTWHGWFWICLSGIVALGAYAFVRRRGTARLGMCVFALDCLLAERIISDFRFGGFLVTVLLVLFVFLAGAWGVHALSEREKAHE